MRCGAKPRFENVSVKFGGGNRYGLIGANGCGKSTFMKILGGDLRSEEHTSELQSLMRISYAVFCLKKKKNNQQIQPHHTHQTTTIETYKLIILCCTCTQQKQ